MSTVNTQEFETLFKEFKKFIPAQNGMDAHIQFQKIYEQIQQEMKNKTPLDTDTDTFIENIIDNNIEVFKRLRNR